MAFTSYFCRFCHAITNVKSPVLPSEAEGGVLADEMGMGKSLSILSLITKTLGNAHDWATNGTGALSNEEALARRQRSRATLVVVSSACGFFFEYHRLLNACEG